MCLQLDRSVGEPGVGIVGDATAFAADPLNLTLAEAVVNWDRKVALDLDDWLPERIRCWYAGRVVARAHGIAPVERGIQRMDICGMGWRVRGESKGNGYVPIPLL